MNDTDNLDISWREKGRALYQVAKFQPGFSAAILVLGVFAAVLEGFGLSFIMPIVELSQSSGGIAEADGLLSVFMGLYEFLGIPFTLGYLIIGVASVMTTRYTMTFLVRWFRAALETRYVRYLQEASFNSALDADVAYFDEQGSDEILNAIVTQAEYAGFVIRYTLQAFEQGLLALIYIALALYLSPLLTIITGIFLGGVTFLFRNVLDTGYSLGDEVADAKEGIQSRAQAGTQGVRAVKLFGIGDELREGFSEAADKFERYRIKLQRNEEAMSSFYNLTVAVTVFVLIYFALTFSAMNVGELGVFLFAMYQLGPRVSNVNKHIYRMESELPHLVRTQRFLDKLESNREVEGGSQSVQAPVDRVEFHKVWFTYDSADEPVLREVSFDVERGDFIAFVGPSGAGKSTIASLLARMYEPNSGKITADGIPLAEFDIDEWRSHVSIVRQNPHIFNDTLRRNITVGHRAATQKEIQEVCEIARVTEFLDELPDGYDTTLGDQGVRLSGGQRQRVAIARALLKDADLLILDEATSDLDTSLEKEVHDGIEAMERDYAMLVIAHRLSTITDADCIYAMENGRIVESGDHGSLISQDGAYSQLYSLQS
ncbi:ABC transporter ATP-binding protein [Natronomonas salina]|uniref:ABC transporter ATP-binding protein n=1 Tax=Natronomonas salina TaxID=1710540 RepID=UPI0015B59E14|nr:ABC transporter ATP-binding protein [Natronomonas salina]QLD90791.1 ABC transporter ATP-binding protein [Natronomonas salina]